MASPEEAKTRGPPSLSFDGYGFIFVCCGLNIPPADSPRQFNTAIISRLGVTDSSGLLRPLGVICGNYNATCGTGFYANLSCPSSPAQSIGRTRPGAAGYFPS
jgi:hypothetical protein